MEFKDKIKIVRQKLMLSQADFAKELGVAFSTVNEWENGIRKPNYIMQRKFATYCNDNNIKFGEE
ncbi:MAG: helix-turn-helix transcriptional regulator [Clostridiales bacterium]|nr:helix-turn-helix transcriptional regulator [Clostridiales bacterium]